MPEYLDHTRIAQKLLDQQGEINDLRAVVAEVRELHRPQPDGSGFPDGLHCCTCSRDGGDGYQYLVPYPCDTIRALGQEETP